VECSEAEAIDNAGREVVVEVLLATDRRIAHRAGSGQRSLGAQPATAGP